MRISLAPHFVLLLAWASTASAAPPTAYLRWNDCHGDGGTVNRSFACDTNAGGETLVGSFVLATDLAQVSGNEIVVDIGFPGTTLPAWWDFKNPGTCRQGSLGIVFSPPITAVNCTPWDWASGSAVGGLAAYTYESMYWVNRARIKAVSAVPLEGLSYLTAGQEYFAFRLTINHQKTVGLGSCSGCLPGACIYLRSLKLTTPDYHNDLTLFPWNTQDGLVTWQNGDGVIQTYRGEIRGCYAATPAKKPTWGEVKSLYR